MRFSNALYCIFIIAVAFDPIFVAIQSFYFASGIAQSELSFLQILRGILLVLLLYLILKLKFDWKTDIRTIKPLLFLVAYALIVAPFSPFPRDGFVWALRVLYLCIIYMSTVVLIKYGKLSKRNLWHFAGFILIVYFASQILAILLGIGGLEAYHTAFGSSGFKVGIAVISWTICSLVPIFFMSGKWKVKEIIMIAIAIASIMLTMRRTALLAILLLIILISLIRMIRRHSGVTVKIVSVLLPVAVSSAIWYVLNNTGLGLVLMDRLADLYLWEGKTASGRVIIQQIGLAHILNRGIFATLFGEGMGYAKVLLGSKLGVFIGMHSDWLDIAISYGLVGLLFFFLFYINLFRLTWKSRRANNSGHFDAMLALLILSLFGSLSSGGILDTSYTMAFTFIGFIFTKQNMNLRLILSGSYRTGNIPENKLHTITNK